MLPAPFLSHDEYRQAFVQGLEEMLVHQGLGVFILVLANATFDSEIYARLRERLAERFELLATRYRQAEAEARDLDDAPDDLAVFERLLEVGFDNLRLTEFRDVGPWHAQFNQLRSFRPARMSQAVVTGLHKPFAAEDFHFNEAFLKKEILWEGDLLGRHARLLYNKFPFASLHGLLVIEPQAERPQLLTEDDHAYVWRLGEELGTVMPSWGFGYNAYGAYASVNHQHFQTYVGEGAGFPVEHERWRHLGGAEVYPVDCQVFDDAVTAWRHVDQLHRDSTPYNLLYRPGRCYLSPRAFQGSYQHADWTGGFAWSELAGACTLFDETAYRSLEDREIRGEFNKLKR